MTIHALAEWLALLENRHPDEIDLGLERVGCVARRLALLPVKVPVITVAGTNGKGSVVATVEALLLSSGYSPAVYTSPHLLRYNERIRVAGKEGDDALIVEAFEHIEGARGDISLTYFEFGTLAAMWVARAKSADIMVLEVGLGGRLDAVNIVDADVAVITSIALDHQEWLGETREQIALEKAGITRAGKPCVLAEAQPPANLLAYLTSQDVPHLRWGRDFSLEAGAGGWHGRFTVSDRQPVLWPALPDFPLQPANVAAAIQACLLLGIDLAATDVARVLAGLALPGRQQHWTAEGRYFWLDVAHNPAAVEQLASRLRQQDCQGRTLAVFAAMADKDIRGMIRACSGVVDQWYLSGLPGLARAATAEGLDEIVKEQGGDVSFCGDTPEHVLDRARKALENGDRLVIFGSFVLIAEGLRLLVPPVNRG